MDHTPQLPQNLRNQVSSHNKEEEEEYGPQIPSNLKEKSSSSAESRMSEPDSPNTYGPALPLHLQKNKAQVKVGDEDDSEAYGPSLPPHLLRTSAVPGNKSCGSPSVKIGTDASPGGRHQSEDSESNQSDSDEYGPSLPPHLKNSAHSLPSKQVSQTTVSKSKDLRSGKANERTFGPVLPPEIMATSAASDNDDDDDDDEEEEEDSYCPALPPHLKKKQSSQCKLDSRPKIEEEEPTLAAMDDKEFSEDDEVYGPMPPSQEVDIDEYIESTLHQRTEATQRRLKEASNTAPKREDWMLTLPEDKPLFAGLGLQARQFSKSGKRDRGDTSVWTDTPADKERKAQRAAKGRAPAKGDKDAEEQTTFQDERKTTRDERLQAAVDRHNDTKRSRPLIDTHQSKQKKVKKDSLSVTGIGADRKPFSREEDLHVNKFDEAQKSSILKKARNLNDRFSSGKSSKFL